MELFKLSEIFLPLGLFLSAYTLGSIPEAWLLTKWVIGRDLRRLGSGNVGVMNTAFNVTRWVGMLVFLTEITKGILAVYIPYQLGVRAELTGLWVVGVVIGTRWPIWLGFKGGRGNTAGVAALVLISLPSLVTSLAIWFLVRTFFKSSFIATRVAILSLPLTIGIWTHSWWYALTGMVLSIIYLGAQKPESDDHQIIKQQWTSFWKFLISPPRSH